MERPSHAMPSPVESAPLPEVVNHTPWPSQYFQHVDPHGEIFHVMVSRISYTLRAVQKNGDLIEPTVLPPEQQTPLCTADEFYANVNTSSVLQESDLAPYKPKCDVVLTNAFAHTPDGKPHERWPAGFRFADTIIKTFQVTGPRQFERSLASLGALRPGAPKPVTQVPLCYELAFGGPNVIRQEQLLQEFLDDKDDVRITKSQREAAHQAHDALPAFYTPNPIGCGRLPEAVHDADKAIAKLEIHTQQQTQSAQHYAAPQIEALNQPYDGQQDYPVVGVGAIGRWWSPRVSLAGTHDDAWKQSQWPKSPLDHDYRYWNCAPEDQQIDYPQGGEEVMLLNLIPADKYQGIFRFKLPTQELQLLVRLNVGVVMFAPMNIDTVILDLATGTVTTVRRAIISAKTDVRQLELGTWPKGTGMELDAEMQRAASERTKPQEARRG